MRVICCCCDILYDLKEPFKDDSMSHGICPTCFPWVMHNFKIEVAEKRENGKDERFVRKMS
jgi:hypothetical protein